jgi:cytochrome c oxidase accessory protein FixG
MAPLDVTNMSPSDVRSEARYEAAADEMPPLYRSRVKVYPKAVMGRFRLAKWTVLTLCLAAYYLAPWLRWDRGPGQADQALLIDMSARRAYFFWIEIWPQEVYYLTGLLILGAVGLFLATSLFGRVWCGYTCPQTVWTDLFMWVERLIEGDRNARIKLDRQPWSIGKASRKALKHGVWVAIALMTGGAWAMYFNDAPTLVRDLLTFQATSSQVFFIGLFTFTTYLLAGWAREQVCTFMCPWPRFQAAMLDKDSLVVTYEAWRGEPRGKHRKAEDAAKLGDCVDCGQCHQVCPTGIDIRDGLQLECIGCALCIDACNGVMKKVGLPPNLISYDTTANIAARGEGTKPVFRFVRPRTMVYAALLAIVALAMLIGLGSRATVEINVLRDRNPLYVTLSDGSIRNGYTIKILNKARAERVFALALTGLDGATMQVVGQESAAAAPKLSVRPDQVGTFRVFLRAPRDIAADESHPIAFTLTEQATGETARHGSTFVRPGR